MNEKVPKKQDGACNESPTSFIHLLISHTWTKSLHHDGCILPTWLFFNLYSYLHGCSGCRLKNKDCDWEEYNRKTRMETLSITPLDQDHEFWVISHWRYVCYCMKIANSILYHVVYLFYQKENQLTQFSFKNLHVSNFFKEMSLVDHFCIIIWPFFLHVEL